MMDLFCQNNYFGKKGSIVDVSLGYKYTFASAKRKSNLRIFQYVSIHGSITANEVKILLLELKWGHVNDGRSTIFE